jgi:ribonuclease HII
MRHVLGVDEAGRGPLAGPVAVGLVRVPAGFDVATEFPGVADSKRLTALARERLFEALAARAARGDVAFAVAYGSPRAIDVGGVTLAVRDALARGIRALAPEPADCMVYLDGLLVAPRTYAQETIVRGDALVPVISLASIAAKVSRDRLMARLATRYPAYAFEKHKGYGTALHYERLAAYGPCALHRRRFLRRLTDGTNHDTPNEDNVVQRDGESRE